MNIKELTFGTGLLLRERVNGWAQSGSGVNHVYPDHPPLKLAKFSYPRATVDVIGHTPQQEDIERNLQVGEALVDVTVYAASSVDVVGLIGNASNAIQTYHDRNDTSGDPYYTEWFFQRTGNISELITDEADEGWTRYSKTMEFEFQHATHTT